jgi:hypothetical protein
MEQSCGPLSVEIVPGMHCDSAPILPREREYKSVACAEVQFPDYGTVFGPLAVEIIQEKH